MHRRFRTELAVMPVGCNDDLPAFADRKCDAIFIRIGIRVGLRRAAARDGDRARSFPNELDRAEIGEITPNEECRAHFGYSGSSDAKGSGLRLNARSETGTPPIRCS